MTNPVPHLFWITSRAAGSAALVLTSLSVAVGLLSALRVRASGRGPELRALHEALALAGIAAIAVHGVLLLGDAYLRATLVDIAIPFAGPYRRGWTGMGIVAGWSLTALGLSYYLRSRIGNQRWRRLHRLSAPAWALGMAHSLGEGTDAGQIWFLAMAATVVVPALILLALRWLGPARGGRPQPRTRSRARVSAEAGEGEHDPGAAQAGLGYRHGSAVRVGHRLDDREPQPGPAP
ncbi:MAG: hypothetical protein QOD53_1354 [Thermoleophilaceae bacterium]|jgi:sulfoxide reductase heme-binding subunit YedZ|nr:hypothetical protein [Thermoleophilaceae bacterium]